MAAELRLAEHTDVSHFRGIAHLFTPILDESSTHAECALVLYRFLLKKSHEKMAEMSEPAFVCHACGQTHEGVPLSFAADFPDMYANMSETDRDTRALISSDQCIVDETHFFIRGCLEIPIHNSGEVFLWGVWCFVKEEVFDEISGSWEEVGRETRQGPFKARLANSLPLYRDTLNLKLRIVIRAAGTRPLFIIEEEHPLAAAQQHGLSWLEAMELAATLLHVQGPCSKSYQ